GDVHLELAIAEVVGIEHLDGVVLTNEGSGVGVAPAVEGVEHPSGPDGYDAVEPPNHLVAVTKILPPAPASRAEVAETAPVPALPAQVQGREEGDHQAEAVLVLDRVVKRGTRSHRGAGGDVGFALGADRVVAEEEIPDVRHEVVLERAGAGRVE